MNLKCIVLSERSQSSQASWHTPAIPALKRREENHEFKASLDYIMKLWLKKKKKKKVQERKK
jgi:hypothetical protein